MKRLHIYFLSCILTFMAGYLPVGAQGLPPDSTVNNIIYYTSSDSAIVMPNNPNAFGANIVSNTYENGQGQIVFDSEIWEIGYCAFDNCTSLTSVEIPNSVTTIGNYAFSSCSSLISVEFPNSITIIGEDVFRDCSNIVSPIFNNSIFAFLPRSYKGNYNISEGIVKIASGAFSGCSGLTAVNIPNSVTEMGYGAFRSCSGLTSVKIPNSVTTIGEWAFHACSSLTSVEIPNSVTTIGQGSFRDCTSLMSVDIPNSVRSIELWAFSGCSSLTSVKIPNSVEVISDEAFHGCYRLESFSGKFASEDHRCLVVEDVLKAFAPFGATTCSIPNGVTAIGGSTFFNCSDLTSVEFPNSLTEIRYEAFAGCFGLTSVEFPNAVSVIGGRAFAGGSLTSITSQNTIPPTIEGDTFDEVDKYTCILKVPTDAINAYKTANNWSEFFNIVAIGSEVDANNVIYYTSTDGEIVTPYNADDFGANIVSNTYVNGQGKIVFDGEVTSFGERAFQNCSRLTSIRIPGTITNIGSFALYGCSGLTTINIPNSVTSIGYAAFSNCPNLESFTGKFVSDDYRCLIVNRTMRAFAPKGLTTYSIPNTVASIGSRTFLYCADLTSVEIPNSVTSIQQGAFMSCTGFKSVTIPETVTYVGEYAFYGCTNLESFNGKFSSEDQRCLIVNGVLNSFAPAGLSTYSIPNSVTSIGDCAFSDCSNIKSIEIPNSVVSIGYSAFQNCSSLTSMEIPNSVKDLGIYTFYGCSNLNTIVLPASLTNIEYAAFGDCNNLKEITCMAITPPSCAERVIENVPVNECVLRVPAESLELYKTTEPWSQFFNIVAIDDNRCFAMLMHDGEETIFYGEEALAKALAIAEDGDEIQLSAGDFNAVDIEKAVTIRGNGWLASDSITPTRLIGDFSITQPITLQRSNERITLRGIYHDGQITKKNGRCSFIQCRLGELNVQQITRDVTEENSEVYLRQTKVQRAMYVGSGNTVSCENTFIYDPHTEGSGSINFEHCMVFNLSNEVTNSNFSNTIIDCCQTVALDGSNTANYCLSVGGNSTACFDIIGNSTCITLIGHDIFKTFGAWGFTDDENYELTDEAAKTYIGSDGTQIGINGGLYPFNGTMPQISRFCVDGIWYNIISEEEKTVEVTYNGEFNGKFVVDNAYRGDIKIPATVNYSNTDYTVEAIGEFAFYGCRDLSSIILPNTIKVINGYSFYDASSLITLEVPNSVTVIEKSAFHACNSLETIVLGESLNTIMGDAFSDCLSIKEISCLAATPPNCVVDERTNVFEDEIYTRCTLYVQEQSLELYKSTEPWSQFFNIVAIGSEVDANNVIYYTSTDGEIVTPYRPEEISGNIVSNTYENGRGMIVFDKDVTYIGDWAFRDCSNLKTVEIPASVEALGLSPFHSCTNLESFTGKFASENHRCLIRNAQLVSFAPAGLTEYEIPDNIVTIGSQSFSRSTELTSVRIPNSVTEIGICAFFECTGLTSVDIPESVNFIGNQAFRYCSSLTSIKIPSAVTTIEDMLFSGCTSLAAVELPNSITSIGEQAFRSCSSLAQIEIPQSVTSIGVSAFASCRSLTSVAIPQNVTIIEEYAFSACSSLASIEIPSSVDSIGSNAFSYCGNVAELTCEATIPPSCGEDVFYNLPTHECVLRVPAQSRELYKSTEPWSQFGSIVAIEENNFINYTSTDGNIVEPYNPDAFGANIISNTYENGQGKIVFDGDVTEIGDYAFSGCRNLSSIEIPNSVSSTGVAVFRYCYDLQSITGKFASEDNRCLIVDGQLISFAPAGLTSYHIPDGVTSIGFLAFEDCTKLESVEIPNSVTVIGMWAFSCCIGLKSLEIPNSVTEIGDLAFLTCTSLTSVNIPNSIIKMGRNPFVYCTSLSSFTGKFASDNNRCLIVDGEFNSLAPAGLTSYSIPDHVTSIGGNAFNACRDLVSIEIPNSVTHIREEAFDGCRSLTSLVIPNSVISIENNTFENCINMTTIELSSSLASIGNLAFSNCNSLNDIICKAVTPPTCGGYVFNKVQTDSCTLSVPAVSLELYKTTEPWSEFFNIQPIGGEIVRDSLFMVDGLWYELLDGDAMTCALTYSRDSEYQGDVEVPEFVEYNEETWNVTAIDAGAFRGCKGLTSIILPPHLGNIVDEEFGTGNPNLLLYCERKEMAPRDVRNVVVDGVADFIRLSDDGDFNCPREFMAKKISYEREFRQHTGLGYSEGWETLALPFDVQTVYHRDKQEEISGFWLRELTNDGFMPASEIHANTPYIISMPNNEEYVEACRLAGRVSFRATNAVVPCSEMATASSANRLFIPTMTAVERADDVYALNVNQEYDGHRAGSIFVSGLRAIKPFEAYILTRQYAPLLSLTELSNGTVGISTPQSSSMAGKVNVYDAGGRQVKVGSDKKGKDLLNDLPEGIYVIKGAKTRK